MSFQTLFRNGSCELSCTTPLQDNSAAPSLLSSELICFLIWLLVIIHAVLLYPRLFCVNTHAILATPIGSNWILKIAVNKHNKHYTATGRFHTKKLKPPSRSCRIVTYWLCYSIEVLNDISNSYKIINITNKNSRKTRLNASYDLPVGNRNVKNL